MDTVVFSTIVSKKRIYDEDYESVKKNIREYIDKYWDRSFTYIKIHKEELEYQGKNKSNSTFRKIA
jgi:chromosome condensin MukBEF complex kleisin-like MukF subunit